MLTDALLFVIGAAVGVMNAVAGGGGLIGFPILMSVGGLSALSANATSYLVVMPGQFAAAIGYREYLRKIPKHYAWLLIPCALGAGVGSFALRHTSNQSFSDLVPELIIVAIGLFAFQPFLQKHFHKYLTKRVKHVRPFAAAALVLFLMSIYGGFFGPGFGFILLAALSFTRLNHMHQMNGLKNIATVVMSLASLAILSQGSFVDWRAGSIMAIGSLLGGYGGARFSQKAPSNISRIVVITIGGIATAYLAVRNY